MIANVTPINTVELIQVIETCFELKEPIYIHGGPGIGKSACVRQACKKNGWKLIDLRLTTIDASDIRGIGIPDREKDIMRWLRPEFFPVENVPTVIFLDELSAAEKRLQASCYQLILDRRVGEFVLPDNVYVMAAGNDVEDGAIAHEMGTALADRFLHVKLQPTVEHWANYAVENNFHPYAISYVRAKPDFFSGVQGQDSNDQLVTPTPRSWEKVSKVMHKLSGNRVLSLPLVQGLVGSAAAADFFSVLDEILELPAMEDLFKMTPVKAAKKVPAKTSALYGLVYSSLAYAKTPKDMEFICELFEEVAKVKDYLPRKEIQTLCMEIWINKIRELNCFSEAVNTPSFKKYREVMKTFASEAA